MSAIRLVGELICKTTDEVHIVAVHLPEHVKRTRAEPGCVWFAVTATADPLVWSVEERFEDLHSYQLHQERTAESEWGLLTRAIERRYSTEGLSG